MPLSTGGVPAAGHRLPGRRRSSRDGGVVYAFSNVPLVFIGATAPSADGHVRHADAGTNTPSPPPTKASRSSSPSPTQNLTGYSPEPDAGLCADRLSISSTRRATRTRCRSSAPTCSPADDPAHRGLRTAATNTRRTPVEARDQSQIEIFGPRVGPTITAHEICDEFVIAPIVAQTILQRELYVRTKFTFKLSWEYCLLDPMDVVTITDAQPRLVATIRCADRRSRRTTRGCSRSPARSL